MLPGLLAVLFGYYLLVFLRPIFGRAVTQHDLKRAFRAAAPPRSEVEEYTWVDQMAGHWKLNRMD